MKEGNEEGKKKRQMQQRVLAAIKTSYISISKSSRMEDISVPTHDWAEKESTTAQY